ncbi:MAG TPA: PspC family transcriptional regulator [Bacteroidia bacterium]|nr:PspC family transcriptional regulator [Bacteroidia bacterium]
MIEFIEKIKTFFERQAFGVCEWWGEKLKIKSASIRLFFIYTSFLAIGSPLIIYLIMAFVLNLRNMVKSKRGSAWDL